MSTITLTVDNPFGRGSGQDPAFRAQPGVKLSQNLWVDPILGEVQTRPRFLSCQVGAVVPYFKYTSKFAPLAVVPGAAPPTTLNLSGQTSKGDGASFVSPFELLTYSVDNLFTEVAICGLSFTWRGALSPGATGLLQYGLSVPFGPVPAFYFGLNPPQPPTIRVAGDYAVRPWRGVGNNGGVPNSFVAHNTHVAIGYSELTTSFTFADIPMPTPLSLPTGELVINSAMVGGRLHLLSSEGTIYSSNVGATDFSAGGFTTALKGSGVADTGTSFISIMALGTKYLVVFGLDRSSIWEVGPSSLSLLNVSATGTSLTSAATTGQGSLYLLNKEGLTVFSEDVFKNTYRPTFLTPPQNEVAIRFFNAVALTQSTVALDAVVETPTPVGAVQPTSSDCYLQSCYSSAYNALFYFDIRNRSMLYVYLGSASVSPFVSTWSVTFDERMKLRGMLSFSSRQTSLGSVPMIVAVENVFNQRHYMMFLDTPEFRGQIVGTESQKLPEGSGFPNFYNEEPFEAIFDSGPIVPVQNQVEYSGLELKSMELGMTWANRASYGTGQPVVTAGFLEDRGLFAPDISGTLNQQAASPLDVLAAATALPTLAAYSYRPDPKPIRFPWLRGRTDRPRLIVKVADAGRFRISFGSLSLVAKFTKKRKDTNE